MKLDGERLARLRLHLVNGLGPVGTRRLLETFPSAEAAWDAGPEAWARAGIGPKVRAAAEKTSAQKALDEWERLRRLGGWMLTIADEAYPPLLKEIAAPPQVLFGLGRLPREPCLAVVGTRRPTDGGRQVARQLSRDLAAHGLVIVSGMAQGIDAAAHEGCLEAGGHTVAVLAHGLDRCYPPEHRPLMNAIARQGTVITEYPLGTVARAGHFLSRNRIISGMSLGTLVVEAGPQSGAMRTATMALEEGREVFAVPGDVRLWASKGPHRLLRDGAVLTESAQDVLDALPPWSRDEIFPAHPEVHGTDVALGSPARDSGAGAGPPGPPDPAGQDALVSLLASGWVSFEVLQRHSGAGVPQLLARLSRWELEGRVVSDGQGRFRLVRPSSLQPQEGPL